MNVKFRLGMRVVRTVGVSGSLIYGERRLWIGQQFQPFDKPKISLISGYEVFIEYQCGRGDQRVGNQESMTKTILFNQFGGLIRDLLVDAYNFKSREELQNFLQMLLVTASN